METKGGKGPREVKGEGGGQGGRGEGGGWEGERARERAGGRKVGMKSKGKYREEGSRRGEGARTSPPGTQSMVSNGIEGMSSVLCISFLVFGFMLSGVTLKSPSHPSGPPPHPGCSHGNSLKVRIVGPGAIGRPNLQILIVNYGPPEINSGPTKTDGLEKHWFLSMR